MKLENNVRLTFIDKPKKERKEGNLKSLSRMPLA